MAKCQLCRNVPATIRVKYGYYRTKSERTLVVCNECNHTLWNGHKITSLRASVTAGIAWYTLEPLGE